MALQHFVQINHITNLSDARYCAGMMVDVLCFELDPQADSFVSPTKFQELTGWVAGVQLAGALPPHVQTTEEIRSLLNDYPLDLLQISQPAQLTSALSSGLPVCFWAHIAEASDLNRMADIASQVQSVILSCDAPALFASINQAVAQLTGITRWLKAYDLDADHVKQLPSGFSGIALKASHEDRPGFKEYGELMDILEALETED